MNRQVYFPGLNAIRFYAAFSVLIFHVSTAPNGWFEFPFRTTQIERLFFNGGDGVTVFFVLSGFLITYLLLTELENSGTIALRKFYTRRALRIWPLYYLTIVIGAVITILVSGTLAIFTSENVAALGFVLFFMPQVANIFLWSNITSITSFIGHLWSIGVEEQFYFVWPFLITRSRKFIKRFLIAFFSIKWFLSTFLYILYFGYFQEQWISDLLGLLDQSRFECIAVGAIGAYLLYKNHQWLRIIYSPYVDKIVIALLGIVIVFLELRGTWYDIFLSVLVIVFILNVATNPRSTLKLENKILNELGKISYGIYIYHPVIIFLLIILFKQLGITHTSGSIYDILIYGLTSILTILIAYLSYHYFEKPFLRIKERFSIWHQTPETHTSSQT